MALPVPTLALRSWSRILTWTAEPHLPRAPGRPGKQPPREYRGRRPMQAPPPLAYPVAYETRVITGGYAG